MPNDNNLAIQISSRLEINRRTIFSHISTVVSINNWLIYILFSVMLFGCDLMEYSDISEDKDVASLINSKYKSQKELIIYGITLDRDYKEEIDLYTIMEPPGIAGPEVLFKEILPKYTLIKILKVERCNNCSPFPENKRLIVEILSNTKFSNRLVEIRFDDIDIGNTDVFVKQ